MKWLIMRGLIREQRHWGLFREIFKNTLKTVDSNAEVFALDFPGFGTEVKRTSPSTIDGIVEDVRARWKKLQSSENEQWGILAVSLGGMVAAHWCSKYPEDFKKIVLINSSMSGLSPIHHRMQLHNFPRIIKLIFSRDLVQREKKILSMTTNLDEEKLKTQAKLQAPYAEKVNRINAVYQMYAAARFKAPKEIKIPMLVLVGDQDRLALPKCSEAIADHFDAVLKRHPTANHDLTTDEPQWIADQVAHWK